MDYFHIDDIEFLSKWSEVPYDNMNPEHEVAAKRIKSKLWEPTFYWAKMFCENHDGYTYTGKKEWRQMAGRGKFEFKHYTWVKIHLEKFYHPDIFFTIGIEAYEKSPIIKIDFQRVNPKELTDLQYQFLQNKIKRENGGAFWHIIPKAVSKKNNWKTLTDYTFEFITEHLGEFRRIISGVFAIDQEKRIARITWNKNGWIMPSGRSGKSDHLESHEGKYGYGHEEWLFDLSKIIDGYHYGFLEPIRKQQKAYLNKFYTVWLYTIDGETKKRFHVGQILSCEVIDSDLANAVKDSYKSNGWLSEMEQQIIESGANSKGFSNYAGVDLFNIRFKPQNLMIENEYTELPKGHEIYSQSRYSFAGYKENFSSDGITSNTKLKFYSNPIIEGEEQDDAVITKTHVREPRAVEITYLHDKLSKSLTRYLSAIYGTEKVTREHILGDTFNRIDIVVNDSDELILFEIKTYASAKTSVREAIGQLFEYNYYPENINAKQMVIVTPPNQFSSEIAKYISYLRSTFAIPMYYATFDWEENLLTGWRPDSKK